MCASLTEEYILFKMRIITCSFIKGVLKMFHTSDFVTFMHENFGLQDQRLRKIFKTFNFIGNYMRLFYVVQNNEFIANKVRGNRAFPYVNKNKQPFEHCDTHLGFAGEDPAQLVQRCVNACVSYGFIKKSSRKGQHKCLYRCIVRPPQSIEEIYEAIPLIKSIYSEEELEILFQKYSIYVESKLVDSLQGINDKSIPEIDVITPQKEQELKALHRKRKGYYLSRDGCRYVGPESTVSQREIQTVYRDDLFHTMGILGSSIHSFSSVDLAILRKNIVYLFQMSAEAKKLFVKELSLWGFCGTDYSDVEYAYRYFNIEIYLYLAKVFLMLPLHVFFIKDLPMLALQQLERTHLTQVSDLTIFHA